MRVGRWGGGVRGSLGDFQVLEKNGRQWKEIKPLAGGGKRDASRAQLQEKTSGEKDEKDSRERKKIKGGLEDV